MRASSSPTSPSRQKQLYETIYCQRGAARDLIKDMKRTTRSDKTACSRSEANQFRLFLHMGAYWLLHALRRAAPKRSRWRGATLETIRRTFVKIAVRVEELKGKIKLAFPPQRIHTRLCSLPSLRPSPRAVHSRCGCRRTSQHYQSQTRSKRIRDPPPSTRLTTRA